MAANRAVQTIALVALALVGMYGTMASAEFTHYNVRIVNRLGPEEQNNAMCTYKSPLGVYSVKFNQDVEWDLPVTGDEPFSCNFYWQNKYVEGQLFVLSQQGQLCSADHKCVWELRPDGVYFLRQGLPEMGERVREWKE